MAKGGSAAAGKEAKGIDFIYVLAAGGILAGAGLVVFIILRYVLTVL